MRKNVIAVAVLLAVLFTGCEDISTVTRQKQLQSISVDSSSAETAFVINKSFSSDGLVIYGHYSDDTVEKEPVSLASFKGFDSTALSDSQTITVLYKGFSAVYTVSIVNSELKSIVVTSKPKLIYNIGEQFDSTGMVVTGYYSDGSTADVTSKCSVVNFESTVSGHKLVNIVYSENLVNQISAVLDVYVSDKTLKGISLTVNKTAYALNEQISSDDLTVNGIYNDAGTDTAVITTYEVLGFDTSAVTGSLTVTIKVNDFTSAYAISVQESLMTGIQVETLPSKTIYGHGETLDLTGLVITGIYADGVRHDSGLSGYTVSALDTTTDEEDVRKLTVTYQWKNNKKFETEFQVAVTAAKMTSISVLNPPAEIYQGQTLDLSGNVLGVYTNNTTSKLNGYTVAGYDPKNNNALGTHNITVAYSTFTFVFKLEVKQAKLTGIEIYTKPSTLVYFQGESFSSAELQLKWTYTNGTFPSPQQNEGLSFTDVSAMKPGVQEVVIAVQGNADIHTSVYIMVKKILSSITLDYTRVPAAVQSDGTYTGVPHGAALDLSGLKVTAGYTDGSTCAVSGYTYKTDYVDAALGGTLTAVDKECTVTVSYIESYNSGSKIAAEAAFKIKVVKPELKKISIVTLPAKMKYIHGDSLDVTGMLLNLIYTDGTYKVSYADNLSHSGENGESIAVSADNLASGVRTCTISAAGISTTMNIQIVPKLTGVRLTPENLSITCPLGTTPDLSPLVVYAIYDDDNPDGIETKDYKVSYTPAFDNTKVSSYTAMVTVKQNDYKNDFRFSANASFTVNVTQAKLLGIKVLSPPTQLEYGYGSTVFNSAGISVGWKYSNSSSYSDKPLYEETISYPPISSDYLVGSHLYSFWVNTDSTITASVTIKIVPVLESITLDYSGDTSIPLGTSLDLSKLKVTANYNDDTSKNITGYTIDQDDLTPRESKEIKVYYTETDRGIENTVSAKLYVTVTDAAVKYLHITTAPSKTTYCLNDRFDPAGMVVEAVKTDGTLINPYTNYKYTWDDGSSCDNTGSKTGERTVIIKPKDTDYPEETVSASVKINVTTAAPTPSALVLYDTNYAVVTQYSGNEVFFKTSYPYVRIKYSGTNGYIYPLYIKDYTYSYNTETKDVTLSYVLNDKWYLSSTIKVAD